MPFANRYPIPLTIAIAVTSGCSTNPPMQEMSDARQSVEAAQTIGAEEHAPDALNSAQQLLSRAETDMQTGAYEEAQIDAVAAREAARQALAITQAKHEASLDAEEQPNEEEIVVAIEPIVEVEVEPPLPAQYTVAQKDNLWEIAAKPSIYGDALLWPLLYKANAGAISDADLIFPGQTLNIERRPSPMEIEAAIKHATSNRDNKHELDTVYLQQYQLR